MEGGVIGLTGTTLAKRDKKGYVRKIMTVKELESLVAILKKQNYL